jgi:hypothetical protein
MTAHATLNGTITDTGDTTCDSRGFDWGYETGVYPYDWTENGTFNTGSFDHEVTGLDLSKTVYFRSKAHNSIGWGYGSEKSFQTPSPVTHIVTTSFIRSMVTPLMSTKMTKEGIIAHNKGCSI